MVSKALYIGAGIDTRPFQICDWITKFYCVDGQPHSEFGTLLSGNIYKDGYDEYARPNFITELEEEYLKNDFILNSQGERLRTFSLLLQKQLVFQKNKILCLGYIIQ